MSKRLLTKKILCAVMAAGAFGVMYNPSVDAAKVNGEPLTADESGAIIVTDDKLIENGSKKFVFGQGDAIQINTEGNAGSLISGLAAAVAEDGNLNKINAIRNVLTANSVVGVVGGEGQLDDGLTELINGNVLGIDVSEEIDERLGAGTSDKILNLDTTKNENNVVRDGSTNVIIGNDEHSPVVIGAIGGDLSVNSGLNGKIGFPSIPGLGLELKAEETSVTRNGDANIIVNNGNVLGDTGASAAIAVGDINVKMGKGDLLNLDLNGKTTTTLNGDVNVGINGAANVAGFTGGGVAAAIGGEADSIVNGSTNIIIDSDVQTEGALDGITAGIAGGGTAITTNGGTANANVSGTTNISVNNGLSAGLVGGGVAAAVDATGAAEAIISEIENKENEGIDFGNDAGYTDITDEQLESLLGMGSGIPDGTIYINRAVDGGTATANTGDTNITLTGTTSAAGVIGGGIAATSHTYTWKGDGTNTEANYKVNDSYGTSIATANSGKSNITVNVEKNLTNTDKTALATAAGNLKNNVSLENAKALLDAAKDKGVVLGIFGGGASIAHGDPRSNANGKWEDGVNADGQGAHSTATNEGADINLVNGYVAATFGGGVAAAVNNAEAKSTTTGDININVGNGTEAVGVFGNGLAYYTGSSEGGTKNLAGKASVEVKNSTINIGTKFTNAANADKTPTVDGILGGGIAIDDSQSDTVNASVKTNGKATINVLDGAEVNTMQLQAMDGLVGKPSTGSPDMGSYLAGVKDVASNVAIAGGGAALGGGAESYVKEAEINIAGGTVNGDIIGGGIAAYGETGKNGAANGGSVVDNATVNLTGGTVKGDVYAGGAASQYNYNTTNAQYTDAQSTVNHAIINWAGSDVEGVLDGTGYKVTDENGTKEKVDVADSTLNVSGENTLSPVMKDGNQVSKITGFDKVNFTADSVTNVEGITAGNTTALIDGSNGAGGKGTITVDDGARLNLNNLATSADSEYLIADNYNDSSKLWNDDQFAYDRTETYAEGSNADNKFTVIYKENADLSDAERQRAVDAAVASFGRYGENTRGIWNGIIGNGTATNPGAKDMFRDFSISTNTAAVEQGLYTGMMLGEDSGVTSNAISMAQDFADNAQLRLSFTQDNLTDETVGEKGGAIWAKYLHNSHDLDDMGSSFGPISADNDYDGIMVGADFARKGNFQSGIAFAYGDGDGSGRVTKNDFDMWGVSLYGNVKNGDTNIIGDIGFSQSSNDIESNLWGQAYNADRDLDIFTMGVRAEKLYRNGDTQIVPYTGLRYMRVNPDDYSTTYNGKKAFDYDTDNMNIWTLPIGVSLRNETVTESGWNITPRLDLAYIWAFGDTDNDLTVNAGSGYDTLNYTVMDSGSFLGSIGVDFSNGDWTYGLGYSYQKGSHAENNRWFVNIDYNF
ncbi:MAG TPA: autotransporter outer membrane beta-barrel domain-containing protein [Candidatus Megamonas gallistercoris]|nr:autotransporter outer membrane beta-barrel domain-containing protein [Candidatus Megamonas gallistercoris]